jgi:hypothetical protein
MAVITMVLVIFQIVVCVGAISVVKGTYRRCFVTNAIIVLLNFLSEYALKRVK